MIYISRIISFPLIFQNFDYILQIQSLPFHQISCKFRLIVSLLPLLGFCAHALSAQWHFPYFYCTNTHSRFAHREKFARGRSHSARVQHEYNAKGIGGLASYRRWPCRRQFTPFLPLTLPTNSLHLLPTCTSQPSLLPFFPLPLSLSFSLSLSQPHSLFLFPFLVSPFLLPSHTTPPPPFFPACLSFHPSSLFFSRAAERTGFQLSTPSIFSQSP